MSPSDQPPTSAGPTLFNRLRKSMSGQNPVKANKDAQSEADVQENVEEEAKSQEEEVGGVENDAGDAPINSESTVAHGEQLEAVTKDNAPGEVSDVVDTQTVEPETHAAGEETHKKQKVTGLERLKSFTKFRKGGRHATEDTTPSSAEAITEAEVESGSAQAVETDPAATGEAAEDNDAAVLTENEVKGPEREENDTASELASGDEKYNDPASLADTIRELVKSLPQPTEPVPLPSKAKLPQLDTSGRPIPPPGAVRVDDKALIAKLRSPQVMNGKAADSPEGEEKPSVFAVLDSFKAPSASEPGNTGDDTNDGDDGAEDDDDEGSDVEGEEPPHIITDDSSVMLYIPLVPTKKSKVEMAKSQIVPLNSVQSAVKERLGAEERKFAEMLSTYRVYGTFGRGTLPPSFTEEEANGGQAKEKAVQLPRFSWKFWPWKKKITTAPQPPAETPAPDTKPALPGSDDKKPEGDGDGDGNSKPTDDNDKKPTEGGDKAKRPHKLRKPKPVLDQRIWIPSNTQISIQALWWGYRIFLPPPIMAILSDKTIEAAKRAAMITTALTWFFSHLPLTMFPAPMQPALLMLQHLVPYLGYIATFISWSWSTLKGYDVGYGVILSATWILPVALIPGSWQAYDFPDPTKTPTTTPGTGTTTPTPSTGAPTQPAPGAPTQPSTGTPSQPSTGTPVPSQPTPPAGGPPLNPETGFPSAPGAPLESPITIGASEELPATMSQRLQLVKGEGVPEDPTMSKRLHMVKGVGVPEDPTMSKRFRMVKGEGVPVTDEEDSGEGAGEQDDGSKKPGVGGIWKYLTRSG
ncbi:hypothetical protein V5O48_001079 [Marasmius crinis-equi]|uniref:Uncharacterized protein n=1 Tax=Marasmius crinis-equi TaxID=585013 RepID=A0ABR3FZZ4_9AGAR